MLGCLRHRPHSRASKRRCLEARVVKAPVVSPAAPPQRWNRCAAGNWSSTAWPASRHPPREAGQAVDDHLPSAAVHRCGAAAGETTGALTTGACNYQHTPAHAFGHESDNDSGDELPWGFPVISAEEARAEGCLLPIRRNGDLSFLFSLPCDPIQFIPLAPVLPPCRQVWRTSM